MAPLAPATPDQIIAFLRARPWVAAWWEEALAMLVAIELDKEEMARRMDRAAKKAGRR
jgi:hypothetical protein